MKRAAAEPAGARLQSWLLAQWYRPQPGWWSRLSHPLSALYGLLAGMQRRRALQASMHRAQPTVPVLVVGNLVVGGAGKTPVTLALVQALQRAGWHPGVVSRGYGRSGQGLLAVQPDTPAQACGDEPLLLRRRAGVPVWVGRDRVDAALALQMAEPAVDVIVCDDALQHRQLRRDVEVWVFDERGAGNGSLLPSGPLREPVPARLPAQSLVLYNHRAPSTALPGACSSRQVCGVWRLDDWLAGQAPSRDGLDALRGRPVLAMAGIAVPERFFALLRDAGLDIVPLPLDDHHAYTHVPWPSGTREVITTEKDAVKLIAWRRQGPTIWVLGIDLLLPPDFVAQVLTRLKASARPRPNSPPTPEPRP